MNYRILHLMIIIIALSTACSCTRANSNDSVATQIDSLMTANYLGNQPGASIIVVKDHQVIFRESYGLANLELSATNRTTTIFRIGSVTKQFTAISILMMVAENKISLTDPVSKFYPELFGDKSPITIKHLLSHTGGIRDLVRISEVRPLMMVDSKPYDLIRIISNQDVDFEPGEQYNYSNSGYIILGGILEIVSGMSFGEFLSEHIFTPLGMKNSYYANITELPPNIAMGYFNRGDEFANAPPVNTSLLFAAGGLWSTVDDMNLWNEALYTEKLIDPKYIKMAFTPSELNSKRATDYGFAFRSCLINGHPSIEHGGGIFGYNSYGIRMEEQGAYVLILSNYEGQNKYADLAARIAAITIEIPYQLDNMSSQTDAVVPDETLKAYAGKYLDEDGDTLIVNLDRNQLTIMKGHQAEKILNPIDNKTFRIGDSLDDRITFLNGETRELVWKPRRSMEVRAMKMIK